MLKRGLTNNQLKIIALVSMLSDHTGKLLFPDIILLQILGRLAFPIFAYMIAEGWTHTRNKQAYFTQMALFAGLVQVGFFAATRSHYQSVLVTFVLAMIFMGTLDHYRAHPSRSTALILTLTTLAIFFLSVVFPRLSFIQDFQIDYGFLGVLFPVNVYLAKNKGDKLLAALVMTSALAFNYGTIQWYGLLALPFLALYNGQRGRMNLKYLFYIFYPVHFIVLYGIKIFFLD